MLAIVERSPTPNHYYGFEDKLLKLPPAPDGRPATYTVLNDKVWVAGYSGTENDDSIANPGRRGFVTMPVR